MRKNILAAAVALSVSVGCAFATEVIDVDNSTTMLSGTMQSFEATQAGGAFPNTGDKYSSVTISGTDRVATIADPHPEPPRYDYYFQWSSLTSAGMDADTYRYAEIHYSLSDDFIGDELKFRLGDTVTVTGNAGQNDPFSNPELLNTTGRTAGSHSFIVDLRSDTNLTYEGDWKYLRWNIFNSTAAVGDAGKSITVDKIVFATEIAPSEIAGPIITGIASAPGEILLSWTSRVGRAYDVASSTDLEAGEPAWSVIPALSNVVADSDSTTVTSTVGMAEAAFYRVEAIPPPPLFFDDFESGVGGWTSNDTTTTRWELGTPAFLTFTNAFSGSNAWGTNLDGPYNTSESPWLRSPPIDLTGVGDADLVFYETKDLEVDAGTPFDFGKVNILATNLTVLAADVYVANATDDVWKEVSVSLPTQALDRVIILEFRLESDSFQPFDMAGWHIDDVTVVEGDAPPPPPPPFTTSVTNFALVESSGTNASPPALTNIVDGATLDLDALGVASTNLNIRAETDGGEESIVWSLTGETTRNATENNAEYYLFGDASNDPGNGTINTGAHTLVATPYKFDGGTGDAGTNLTVNFTVTFTP